MTERNAVKRYLVFGFTPYEPKNGGWEDFLDAFETIEEARERATDLDWTNWHECREIVDLQTMNRVESWKGTYLDENGEQKFKTDGTLDRRYYLVEDSDG